MYSPISTSVINSYKTNAVQHLSITVTPVLGSSFELTSADVITNGLNINRYTASGEAISFGSCVAAELTLRLENGDGRFNSIAFEGAELYVRVGTQIGSNISWMALGYFTVDNVPRALSIVEISALDRMVQFDKDVNLAALNLPSTVANLVSACCNECNVTLGTTLSSFPNASYTVTSTGGMENMTYRTILQWCAQIMGVCGYIDWQGHLCLDWYSSYSAPYLLTGNLLTVNTTQARSVTQLKADIKAVQKGDGVPSATNIRPFVGFSSVTVSYTGTNVWDEQWELGTLAINDGSPMSSTTRIRSKNFIPVQPNTTYYLKCPPYPYPSAGIKSTQLFFYDISQTWISKVQIENTTFTTPANAYYIKFTPITTYGTTYNNDISINYPPTDHDYHAYDGTTYTKSLGTTVYGGNINFTTGLLTVTHGYIASYSGQTLPGEWQSDRDVYAYGTTPTTGAQVVYRLASSTTSQLSGTSMTTKAGNHYMWADSGALALNFSDSVQIAPADRYSSDIYENSITITGILVKGKENTGLNGSTDYALVIEGNNLIAETDVTTIANGLGTRVGFTYHPFSASTLPMPYVWPLDMVAVYYKGTWYTCAVTETDFTISAPTKFKGTGESSQSRSYARLNPLTSRERAIVASMEEVNATLNKAVNNAIEFNDMITNALGLYITDMPDGSGGTIRYMHDAPNIADSGYVVTINAGGFAWTTDWNGGDPVWNYGITSSGFAMFRRLSAEGIDVTNSDSDYRAEVTPEHFNIYYRNELIITIDATDRAIKAPRIYVPYSNGADNYLRIGNLLLIPTDNGANAIVIGS